MKNSVLKLMCAAVLAGFFFTSCTMFDDVVYTVTPDPLEMHGDSVNLVMKASIGEKKINKKAIADVTPVIRWEGGEKQLKMVTIQGEKAVGNGYVINSKTGGDYTYRDRVLYQPGMENSQLIVTAKAGKGTKREDIGEMKVADGVIVTPLLLMDDDKVIAADDKFERVTMHNTVSTINYLVNSSKVRANELRDEDMENLKGFIKELNENERMNMTSITTDAYASPEGKIEKNENLAEDRAKTSVDAVSKVLKKGGVDPASTSIEKKGRGEDWEGFRELMVNSDIEDKNLIIRILETYTDKDKREEEIKNLAATYVEIAKDILPELRRSQMKFNYELTGFSDEELMSISLATPDSLKKEEILRAGSLHASLDDKLAVYSAAERNFPDDYRAANNVGYILFLQNKLTEAEAKFKKADQLESNPITSNNLGVIARLNGDRDKAEELFRGALSAGPEASYNLGLVNIANGDYSEAVSNMSGTDSFNAALAQLLDGSRDGASATLAKSADADSAMGLYLKAIIAARGGDEATAKTMLGQAIAKDGSLADKAKNDAEFIKFRDTIGM